MKPCALEVSHIPGECGCESCGKNPGGHRRTEMGNSKPISIPWQREVQDGMRRKPETLPFSVPCPEPSLLSQPCPHQPHPPLHGDHHGFGSWRDLSLIPSWSQPSSGGGLGAVYLPRRWLQEPWHGGSLGHSGLHGGRPGRVALQGSERGRVPGGHAGGVRQPHPQ